VKVPRLVKILEIQVLNFSLGVVGPDGEVHLVLLSYVVLELLLHLNLRQPPLKAIGFDLNKLR
jgi:hypothetical protein